MKKRIFAIVLVAVMSVVMSSNAFAARNHSDWFDLERINAIDVAENLTDDANREEVALLIAQLCKEQNLLPNKRVIEFADRREFSSSAAREAIEDLSATGIVCGYPDGEFKPDRRITRAEALAIVLRTVDYFSLKTERYNRGSSFTDTEGHWAEVYCDRAYEEGLVSGRGNGKFYPDDDITREEIITILVNLMGESNNPLIAAVDKIFDLEFENSFNDYDSRYDNDYYDDDDDYRDKTERPVIDLDDYDYSSNDDNDDDNNYQSGNSTRPNRPVVDLSGSTAPSAGSKPQRPVVDLTTDKNNTSTPSERPVVDVDNSSSNGRPTRPIV